MAYLVLSVSSPDSIAELASKLTDAVGANSRVSITTVTNATETFTKVAHGFAEGAPVSVSSTAAIPAGLSTEKIYYVKKTDADNFKLALSPGGSAVNITDDGSGTIYVCPIADGRLVLNKVAEELFAMASGMKSGAEISLTIRDTSPAVAISGSGSESVVFYKK